MVSLQFCAVLLIFACDAEVTGNQIGSNQTGANQTGSNQSGSTPIQGAWNVASSSSCRGSQTEFEVCNAGLPCAAEPAVDCKFSVWGGWSSCDCTGLQARRRDIALANNGAGVPCSGELSMTKRCAVHCNTPVDCAFNGWTPWSVCVNNQQTRERKVKANSEHGGKPCLGSKSEIQACGRINTTITNCELDQWGSWSECNLPCGGYKTRARNFVGASGGNLCSASLSQQALCTEQPCNKIACVLSKWSSWDGCSGGNGHEERRSRYVLTKSVNGGDCSGDLKQYRGCPTTFGLPADCELSDWSEWSQNCSKTCDGGQQFRGRHVTRAPTNDGTCNHTTLRESRGCNTNNCLEVTDNCVLATWGAWSSCTATCGSGQEIRLRSISQMAKPGGQGCVGEMKQARVCPGLTPCEKIDCEWDNWGTWSACSCSCDGGTKQRNRQVKSGARNGGALCIPKDKTQIAECNTQSCIPKQCKNATWGTWISWSACSVSCGSGFQKRKRFVEEEATPSCGKPVEGHSEEFKKCEKAICRPDKNCSWGIWSGWSACSCTCYGVQERTRVISSYAEGQGNACEGSVKDVQPCNPTGDNVPSGCPKKEERLDCVLETWSQWSGCTTKCGGAHRTRDRSIKAENKNGGKPCVGAFIQASTDTCSQEPCELVCQDCEWSNWQEWSPCLSNGAEQHRERSFSKVANYCGKACALAAAQEVKTCELPKPAVHYCYWKDWVPWGACSASCGKSTQTRIRSMHLSTTKPVQWLFVGDELSVCYGTEHDTRSCATSDYSFNCPPPCQPVDCVFGAWSGWSIALCDGLSQRFRVVTTSSGCGGSCNGVLIETKSHAHVACGKAHDCVWEEWTKWSSCSVDTINKRRERSIMVSAKDGGQGCVGPKSEVKPCNDAVVIATIPCQISEWAPWNSCSATCGQGTQQRTRFIQRASGQGGAPCTEALSEIQGCQIAVCAADQNRACQLAEWRKWSGCFDGQQDRERKVAQTATGVGLVCNEPLRESRACTLPPDDCDYDDWSAWEECDTDCGGGQTMRQRIVHQVQSGNGTACPQSLQETKACNMQSCSVKKDCELGEWAAWSDCSQPCGIGQQDRKRTWLHLATKDGNGCDGLLWETRGCSTSTVCPDTKDCEWGDWQDWDACSCPCGGGNKHRHRQMTQAPRNGGKMCDARAKFETGPCNTQSCEPVRNGALSEWTVWNACSSTCGGGVQKRTRRVETEANQFGKPVNGELSEVRQCSTQSCGGNVDCLFDQWQGWSACSRTCFGTRSRTRLIGSTGRGNGLFCTGDTYQLAACNNASSECVTGKLKVDCKFSDWTEWEVCSASCGKGQYKRSRFVEQQAARGGRGCNGPMEALGECLLANCSSNPAVDCMWSTWADWSACTKCAGQRVRSRHIKQKNEFGGRACDPGAEKQTEGCKGTGKSCQQTSCYWADWRAWSDCSTSCGVGKRSRQRQLAVTTGLPQSQLLYDESVQANIKLREMTKGMKNNRIQELVVSFAAGAFSLVVLFGCGRLARSTDQTSTSQRQMQEMEVMLEAAE